jgi:hypothetical protein
VRRWPPWALAGVSLALTAAGLALLLATMNAPVPSSDFGFRGFSALFAVAFSAVGALIAARRPGNSIGWLLLGAGVASGGQVFTEQYATYGVLAHPGSLPAAVDVAWVQSWIWVIPVGLLGGFVFLLFPDGRPLSPRWGRVLWAAGAAIVLAIAGDAIAPGPIENFHAVSNPFGVGSGAVDAVAGFLLFSLIGVIALSAASLFVRFRKASGDQRAQLKWVAYAGAAVAITLVPASVSASGFSASAWAKTSQIVLICAFASLPVAVGIAVLRYRLYDIDRIINRSLVYVLLTAFLGGMYAALAVGLGSLAGAKTNSLVIAGSTLVVAALFSPARRRIQAFIDRRFYRRRYDATRTLEAFSSRLRDEVDLDQLRDHLLAVVGETMQPARATLWLRPGKELP